MTPAFAAGMTVGKPPKPSSLPRDAGQGTGPI